MSTTYRTARRRNDAKLNTIGAMAAPVERLIDRVLELEPHWVLPLLPLVFVRTPCSWLALLAAILPWLLRLARYGYMTRRTAFDPAIALVVFGGTVGLYASPDAHLSFEALQSYVAGVITYYVFVNHPRHLKLYVVYLFLASLAGTLWVFSQGSVGLNKFTCFNGWVYDLAASLPKVTNHPAYPNALAGLLAVAAPIAAGLALYAHRRGQMLVGGGLVVILSLALVLTGSRAGMVGLALSLSFVALWRTRWVLLVPPLVAGVGLSMTLGRLAVVDQMWANPWSSTAGGRLVIWLSTLHMLPDLLYAGTGPGAYALVYRFYAPPWDLQVVTNPHNALLQLWADAGIFGALAALLALGTGLRLGARILRLPPGRQRFGLAVGLLGGVIGATVHGTFESAISGVIADATSVYHYVVSPLPWVLAGLVWIVFSGLRREDERHKRVIGPAVVADVELHGVMRR